jgi:predicted RND superfamily exporter protein
MSLFTRYLARPAGAVTEATQAAPGADSDRVDPGRLGRLAHFIARHRWPVIGTWIVLTLFGAVAAGQLSSRWSRSFSIPGKPAYEASQRALKAIGAGVRAPNVVVFHTSGNATKNRAIEQAMQRAAATVPGARTSSYLSTGTQPT